MSAYLFDMEGDVIAFRRTWTDPHLFDAAGNWIGWLPWDDNDAVDPDGRYLGTIVDDRLVRRNDWCQRQCASTPPERPGAQPPSGTPTAPHLFPNRFAYEDVRLPDSA